MASMESRTQEVVAVRRVSQAKAVVASNVVFVAVDMLIAAAASAAEGAGAESLTARGTGGDLNRRWSRIQGGERRKGIRDLSIADKRFV